MIVLLEYILLSDDNQEKFKEIYDCYAKNIYDVSYAILHNVASAEDATQETLIYICIHLEKIKIVKSHEAKRYIQIVSKCKAIDMLRKTKRESTIFLDDIEEYLVIDDPIDYKVIQNEQIRIAAQCIGCLSPKYKVPLELFYLHELSRKEIAKLLSLKYDTVKKRIRRGNQLLKAALKLRGWSNE